MSPFADPLGLSMNAKFNTQNVVIDETSSELKARPIGNLVFDTIRTNGHFIS